MDRNARWRATCCITHRPAISLSILKPFHSFLLLLQRSGEQIFEKRCAQCFDGSLTWCGPKSAMHGVARLSYEGVARQNHDKINQIIMARPADEAYPLFNRRSACAATDTSPGTVGTDSAEVWMVREAQALLLMLLLL